MPTEGSTISALPVTLLVVNERLEVVDASRPAFAVFGQRYYPDDPGRTLPALAAALRDHPTLAESLGAAVHKLRKPGMTDRFAWQMQARYFTVGVAALPGPGQPRWAVSLDERTEQVTMERENARARSYLESVMASLHLGIIVTDRALRVTNMNRKQEAFLKAIDRPVSLIEAVGVNLAELFPDEAESVDQIRRDVLEAGAICGGIVERFPADKGELVFAVSFSPLRDEQGATVGMIRVCEDVTDKDKMERELHQAAMQASEVDAIRKLMVTLNHEINNSLMTIMGNAELLLRGGAPLPEEQQQMVAAVYKHAEKIASVTQKLESLEQVRTDEYLKDGPEMIVTG